MKLMSVLKNPTVLLFTIRLLTPEITWKNIWLQKHNLVTHIHTHLHKHICVGPSLLLVSGVSVSIDRLWSWTDYRHTNTGREETPGSAKHHGRTALQGPAAWESPVWQVWKQIKCRGVTIRRSFTISLFLAICAPAIKKEKTKQPNKQYSLCGMEIVKTGLRFMQWWFHSPC